MTEDKLEEIFHLQKKLDSRILDGTKPRPTKTERCMAIIHEVIELHKLTNWKWWKQPHYEDKTAMKEELADVWHFVVSLSIEMNVTPDELLRLYKEKNQVNHDRQEKGY